MLNLKNINKPTSSILDQTKKMAIPAIKKNQFRLKAFHWHERMSDLESKWFFFFKAVCRIQNRLNTYKSKIYSHFKTIDRLSNVRCNTLFAASDIIKYQVQN